MATKKKEKHMTQIQLRIEDKLKKQFQAAADRRSLPLSAWIRVCCLDALKQQREGEKPAGESRLQSNQSA